MASTKVIVLDNVCSPYDRSPVNQVPSTTSVYNYRNSSNQQLYLRFPRATTTNADFDLSTYTITSDVCMNDFNIGLVWFATIPAFGGYSAGDVRLRVMYSLNSGLPSTIPQSPILVDISNGGPGNSGYFNSFQVVYPSAGGTYTFSTATPPSTTFNNVYLVSWSTWNSNASLPKNVVGGTNGEIIDLNSPNSIGKAPTNFTLQVTLGNTGTTYALTPNPTTATYSLVGLVLGGTSPGFTLGTSTITVNGTLYYITRTVPTSDPDPTFTVLPAIIFNVSPPTASPTVYDSKVNPTFAVKYDASGTTTLLDSFFSIGNGTMPYFYMYDANLEINSPDITNTQFILLTPDQLKIVTVNTGSSSPFSLTVVDSTSIKSSPGTVGAFSSYGYWYTDAVKKGPSPSPGSSGGFHLFYVSTTGTKYVLSYNGSDYMNIFATVVPASPAALQNPVTFTCMMCTPTTVGGMCLRA